MAMAAGVPPPLPARAYIRAPRASQHSPSHTPELPHLPPIFVYPIELAAAALEARPLASIFTAVASPPLSLPPKLLHFVRKHSLASLSCFSSRAPRRRSPAVRPLWHHASAAA
jgi:hypothetical protein